MLPWPALFLDSLVCPGESASVTLSFACICSRDPFAAAHLRRVRGLSRKLLERCRSGLSDSVVLLARAAAYTDRTDNFAVLFQRYAASKDHYLSAV